MKTKRGFTLVELPAVSTSKRSAFTLVELLVVIGIIALLISILLPSLQSARKAAETVKCEASLREIGNAMAMYVNDSKGWAPPAKTLDSTNNGNGYGLPYVMSYPNWNPPTTVTGINQYWYNFLARYVTRTILGGGTSNMDARAQARSSILWGCPAWQGYLSNGYIGGINYSQTGYGFNAYPEYTSSRPTPADPPNMITQIDSAAIATPSGFGPSWENWIQATKQSSPAGKWYKFRQYTNPSERALVGDTIFWLLEVEAAYMNRASNTALADGIPGQNASYNTLTYTMTGQGFYDFYRHGVYPRVIGGGTSAAIYDPHGGKVRYNVLFCDGHVATMVDRESGYKAARMRFPG